MHLSGCNVDFSADYPLNLDIQIRNANVVTNSPRRSITSGAPTFAATGAPYTTGDGVQISAGEMIDSRKTGNHSVFGSASKDGLW